MLTHDLILEAAQAVTAGRRHPVGVATMQRRLRVGFATGVQLLDALTAMGVLAATRPARDVLWESASPAAVADALHSAVAEGRVVLDDGACVDCPADRAAVAR